MPRLKEELAGPLRRMQEFARNIARVSKESKLDIKEDDYVQSFRMGLMDAVYQWCRGAKFSDICKVCRSSSARGSSRTDMTERCPTCSRAHSSESSADSKSYCGKWRWPPKSSVTTSSRTSSSRVSRSWRDNLL